MNRVFAVAVKEFRQIARDRRSLAILIFLPAFFLLMFGYALNFDIRHVTLAVEDRDQSPESRELIGRFAASPYFDVVALVHGPAEASARIDRGQVRALLVVPAAFAADLGQGRTPAVQIVLDGDNANAASTILGYATGLVAEASAVLGAGRDARLAVVEPRVWYNPELRSSLFLIPGLIAYIAMITAVVSTALSIVKEKENGTIEQIRMAPISTTSFVVGKALPYLLLSQVAAMLVVLAAMVLFDLPMRGDWFTLNLLLAVFLVGALGTGIVVSTMADTQQVAFQAAMLVAFLPTFLLSGFIFPIASMPVVLQYITYLVPARYFLVALRGVVLKGLDLSVVWPSVVALVLYATVVFGLSAIRLAKR
ncbi:MAG TPA: ABC transporter permease [Vicinamibacterales bacterium]|nr:ABC transporter permease [Vicinamibacterales bacterium]